MAYTTIDKPSDHFNVVGYTGDIQDSDGTSHDQAITGVGFQPDWVWHKGRNQARQHILVDSVRGTGGSPTQMLGLSTQDQNLEVSQNTNGWVKSLDSDGFTVTSGNDSSSKSNNAGALNNTYVAWCWKCDNAFSNDASATSIGTIDSSGKNNQTAGLSIATWTGTGSAGTVAHGLGGVPESYWIKVRTGATNNWAWYHKDSNANPEQYAFYIDGGSASTDDSGIANDTAPTSTVFSLTNGNYGNINTYTYVGYFFRSIPGYCKVGTYRGLNQANNVFIYTGFKPKWFMVKNVEDATNVQIYDTFRDPINNGTGTPLGANEGNAEDDNTSYNLEFLSNGIKMRSQNNNINKVNQYVYIAIAERPLVSSSGVPGTAH